MEEKITLPKNYWSKLNIIETQKAISMTKEIFERELSHRLQLTKVQAPLLVRPETGLNDDLNGVEKPAEVTLPNISITAQIVQSLAKWKRYSLKKYGFPPNTGIFTNMLAIRPCEYPDALHSITVDQWDWEKIILEKNRNITTLQETAQEILNALYESQKEIAQHFPAIHCYIEKTLHTVTSQELEDLFPNQTAPQREANICKEYKSVFLLNIGDNLKSGRPHDGRAPDYDDWSLNGDLLIWSPLLKAPVEISSMGIRVNAESLKIQLKKSHCEKRAHLPFHQMILKNELPFTIGGGIGQSRVCMLILEKAHIGEVQASIWPKEMEAECESKGIHLL